MTVSRVQPGVPAGGQFATQQRSESEVQLSDPTDQPFNPYRYVPAGVPRTSRFPQNVTQARAALRNRRGEPNGAVRVVFLNMRCLPPEADVTGPADGRPLLLIIDGGFGRLNIRSGNVVVRAGSRAGNVITSLGDSQVTVIASKERKVSTSARDNSRIAIIPDEGSRGYQGVYGPDANTIVRDVGTDHRVAVYEHRDRNEG